MIDQTDLRYIRNIVFEIAKCLNHVHSKNMIHGDLKPKNILRTGGAFILIDFDGSAESGIGYGGIKISSVYSPPEFIYQIKNSDDYALKQYDESNESKAYEFVIADPSIDAWSLGIVVFFLLTNSTFFQCDSVSENISNQEDLKNLFQFVDKFKLKQLAKIKDVQAQNLVFNLLNKDPLKVN